MNSYSGGEIFDFTHEISDKMTIFPRPWHQKTELTPLGTLEDVGRRSSQISIGTHSGTHIDAPSHFIKDGKNIDEMSLNRFVGSGYVLDLTQSTPATEISLENIHFCISKLNFSLAGNGIFFNFGFGRYFNSPDIYYKDQPWISQDAADYLASLSPSLLGYDIAMLDNPSEGFGCDPDSPIHKIFLSQSIPLVENAIFPLQFSGHINYSVTPLKLKGLDGSPVRFVGWAHGDNG